MKRWCKRNVCAQVYQRQKQRERTIDGRMERERERDACALHGKCEIFFKLNCTALKLILLLRFVSVFSRRYVAAMPWHKGSATSLELVAFSLSPILSLGASRPLQVSICSFFCELKYKHACIYLHISLSLALLYIELDSNLAYAASYRLCKSADPSIYAITTPRVLGEMV